MAKVPSTWLFVGDLSSVCTEGHMRELFETHGYHVMDVKMMGGKPNSTSFDYGFVQLYSVEEAESALMQLNGIFLCGRKLQIRWAGPNIKNSNEKRIINSVHIRFQTLRVCLHALCLICR